ncbi:hypothetical protein [Scytonema sp. PCC 10023]|uniref:hypothetical protein n=1 Tax=Scytonema sp. PCC 10023 TaxID=1680591 RepID=UPI0039C6FCC3
MGNYKQPIDKHDQKAERIRELRTVHRAGTGIGGGLVGAAIGGLLGRKLGGISGAVVGAVAGALVGKGTAQRVNRTVESVVDAARSVAEGVNHSVVGVGNALKDTIDEVKPSVVGVVDAVKNTVDEVKPSVVDAAKTVAEGVKYNVDTVTNVGDALKDTIDQVKPSVIGVVDAAKGTVEEVKPSVIGVVDTLKDTVDEVKPSVVGAAKTVAELVNNSVNGVGDTLKDTNQQNNPSVTGEEDATKATPEAVNHTIKDTVNQVKQSVIGVEETAKDTDEEVKLSGNHNNKIDEALVTDHLPRSSNEHPLSDDFISSHCPQYEDPTPPAVLLPAPPPRTPLVPKQTTEGFLSEELGVEFHENSKLSDEVDIEPDISEQVEQNLNDLQQPHSFQEIDIKELKNFQETDRKEIEYKDIQQKEKEFQHSQQETTQQVSQPSIQPQTEKIQKASGIIVGSVILTLIGVTFGLSQKQNSLVIKKSSAFSQSLLSTPGRTPETTPERNAQTMTYGWIFIGNINKGSDSELVGKPLIKNSQSTDSPVVPSVGSVVTVNVEPGVTLRNNTPQAPNFSPQEQKALAVLKPQEKLKILKVELIKPPITTESSTKVWAKVYRCGSACL